MLHLEFGIQIEQGWQFLHYCLNTNEQNRGYESRSVSQSERISSITKDKQQIIDCKLNAH